MRGLLLAPEEFGTQYSLSDAYRLIGDRGTRLPESLLPFCVVDEASIACVLTQDDDYYATGEIVRVFLTDVEHRFQCALLDMHPLAYMTSLEEELPARDEGLRRVLDEIGPAYQDAYLAKEKRPRDFIIRPVRIACQNVIVGLAAFAQEPAFDGLVVAAWQTCEVPHVATHEANRALAALTLCDAFQNGGTMEIRFDRDARIIKNGKPITYHGHPEKQVPASLRRFGRTVGVMLGAEDPKAITPDEARDLFLAITPMPAELRERVDHTVAHRGITPERMCFLLLSQVWREIEMDYLLAATPRSQSILSGGAAWTDRAARQAESEICRGAVTAGMLFRRLNATDSAANGTGEVRVVEDRTKGITWSVNGDESAITLTGIDPREPVPWTFGLSGIDTLTVYPRTAATDGAIEAALNSRLPGHKALLLPADVPGPATADLSILRCPDRLADIDKSIEERLLKSRISRG